jgi:hypothetical protein
MCFAYGTEVVVPDGRRAIEHLAVDDALMAGSAAGGSWSWMSRRVEFSMGTGPGSEQTMAHLEFGDGQALVVTLDQPMLIAGGVLKTASRLVPGMDVLIAADGSDVPLWQASLGRFKGGIHSVATERSGGRDTGLDGHLLLCGGVICGDYVLQTHRRGEQMAQDLPGAMDS